MTLAAVHIEPEALTVSADALAAAKLPIDDLGDPGRMFWRIDGQNGTAGFGGIEGDGPDRLLRSIVVLPGRRGRGLGSAIVGLIEAEAKALGAERLHLLTTDAAPFFRLKGYRDAVRGSAPVGIMGTAQFRSLCPASATYLVKELPSQ